ALGVQVLALYMTCAFSHPGGFMSALTPAQQRQRDLVYFRAPRLWQHWPLERSRPMKQTDLDRAVARATGENVTQIRKLGFHLVPNRRPPAPHRQRQQGRVRPGAAR